MADANDNRDGLKPPPAFLEALARVKERRRQDPNWSPMTEYRSPYADSRTTVASHSYRASPMMSAPPAIEHIEPQPMPRRVLRTALPFGQRIRDLRRALGLTQREVAWQLGVSARSIIRYEQGRSAPVQSAPLLALRRLESAHAVELDACEVFP